MTILIKGSHVAFEFQDGSIYRMNPKYGIIHDPEGTQLNRCDIFFGPYTMTGERVKMTRAARAYFGSTYKAGAAVVDIPDGDWKVLGTCVQIFYKRRGKIQPTKFFHELYKGKPASQHIPVPISKNGTYVMMTLPEGCQLNDRGFIYP